MAAVLITHVPCFSYAQLFDSIASGFKYKPTVDVRLDSRNSFITTLNAKISGVKVGLVFNQTVKLGIGYDFLNTGIFKTIPIYNAANGWKLMDAKFRMNYVCGYFEYVFYRDKRWEHSIPLQFGYGTSFYKYAGSDGRILKQDKHAVLLYEPAMTAQYKIVPWAAVGVGLGYRLLLVNNRKIDQQITSPIYVLKFGILFSELYMRLMPDEWKEKISEKKNALLR